MSKIFNPISTPIQYKGELVPIEYLLQPTNDYVCIIDAYWFCVGDNVLHVNGNPQYSHDRKMIQYFIDNKFYSEFGEAEAKLIHIAYIRNRYARN